MDRPAEPCRARAPRDNRQLGPHHRHGGIVGVPYMLRPRRIPRRRRPLHGIDHYGDHQLAGHAGQRSGARSGMDVLGPRRGASQRADVGLRPDARGAPRQPHHAPRQSVAADGAGGRIHRSPQPCRQHEDHGIQGARRTARPSAGSHAGTSLVDDSQTCRAERLDCEASLDDHRGIPSRR